MANQNASASVSLRSFPSDKVDALTMLYLQNQNLRGKTQEELASMYDETWSRISQAFKGIREKKTQERIESREYTPIF